MELSAPAIRRAARLFRRDVLFERRKTAPTAAGRDCERSPGTNRTGNRERGSHSLFALHGAMPLPCRTRLLLAQRCAIWQSGDFYTSSDVMPSSAACWRAKFDEMWRVLGAPENIALVELGSGRGLFAQDVLDWSEKKFPDSSAPCSMFSSNARRRCASESKAR